jgi:hypothetical protein
MHKAKGGLFLSLVFVYIIFIGGVFAKENFISPEKALESLFVFSEIKSLEYKYHCEKFQCVGYGFGTSVERWPEKDYPFYILRFDVTQDVEIEPGIYLAKEIYAGLFYIDAYTAKVYPEDITQEIIAEKKADAEAINVEKSVLIDKELDLKVALEKIYKDIEKRISLSAGECKSFMQEFLPLFLWSVNAVTPEIRLQGIGVLKKLADISIASGEYKNDQVISALIDLLKVADYRVRYDAVTVLAAIGDKEDNRLIAQIIFLSNDANQLVKKAALKALNKLGMCKLVK